jgi:hypothetical protein
MAVEVSKNQEHDFPYCCCKTCGAKMMLCIDQAQVKYYALCTYCQKYAAVDLPEIIVLGAPSQPGKILEA